MVPQGLFVFFPFFLFGDFQNLFMDFPWGSFGGVSLWDL
jgi:hypothetical protein